MQRGVMPDFALDAIVVGAGAVGLACARALAIRGLEVVVLEAGERIGEGISSRNSEVLHAGIYYPTGSLRARLCVEGNRMVRAYLEERGIAIDPCGKLVVATEPAEIPTLSALHAQAVANDVEQLTLLDGAKARRLEPALRAEAALQCGTSAVFDSHGYMLAMLGDIEDRQGRVAYRTPFVRAEQVPDGFIVHCGGDDPATIQCRLLVLAAGLGAQAAASALDAFPASLIPPGHLAKGSYFTLQGPSPFSRLIYPLPVPGSLGCHYRRDIGGIARFGPDIQWVEREDYSVSVDRLPSFLEAIRRYWPGVDGAVLTPDYAGIRPKIHGHGEPQPDFVIHLPEVHGLPGLAALFGIESPGLTASMAIADYVAAGLVGAR